MSLLVVGSVGIDIVETPEGKAENVLGCAAAYFAYAASFFCPVKLVSAVGGDFPSEFRRAFQRRPIDLSGLAVLADEKSFRWHGRYTRDMNQRETVSV